MTDVLGRRIELATIADVLERAPSALVLYGEAGIGKTTLWRAAAAKAAATGRRVLVSRPAQAEAQLSFAGLADLIDDSWDAVRDRLPQPQRHALDVVLLRRDPGDAPLDPRTVGVAFLSVLRALSEQAPLVIAIDDVQWLDAPTLSALSYAIRRITAEPVTLLATARATTPDAVPLRLAGSGFAGDVAHIPVSPLGLTELHHLIRDRIGLELSRPVLKHLHQVCGGNPLFALETAARMRREASDAPTDILPTPSSATDLIAERVATLPEPTREALLYAAAQRRPSAHDIRAALGVPDADVSPLAAAEEAGLIEIRRGTVTFGHPLFAAAVYSTAPSEHRRHVHRRLSEVVDDDESRAWHLALATDGEDAGLAALLDRAARRVMRRGAPGRAAQLWELAARHTPAGHTAARAERITERAGCLFAAGDARAARNLFERALPRLPPGLARARALSRYAEILFYEGSTVDAVHGCREALEYCGDDHQLRAGLHLRLAWFGTHDSPEQERNAREALRILRGLGGEADPELLALALAVGAMYRMMSGGGLAHGDVAEAARLFEVTTPRTWAGEWAWTAIADWDRYFDLPRARELFTARFDWAGERGEEHTGHMLMLLSELDFWLGDWGRSRSRATEALDLLEQSGQRRWRGFCLYALAQIEAHLGEVDGARAHSEAGLALAESADDPYVAVLHLQVLGFTELSLGNASRAVSHLDRAAELVDRMGIADPARHAFHADQVEALIAAGNLDAAGERLRDMERRVAVAPRPWLVAVTGRCRVLLHLATGDAAAAERAAEEALKTHGELPMPFERARTLLVKGCVLRVRKQKKAARDTLEEALAIFDGLGAVLWSRRAAEELSRCGQRHGPPTRLTPTEARVVELVCEGLTNREIAATAHLSVKTVEANLSSVYRKLGVRGRLALIRLAGSDPRVVRAEQ